MRKYIIKIAIIMIVSIIAVSNLTFAIDFGDADAFIGKGETNAKISDLNEVAKPFTALGNVLRFIGVGIVVIATTYMGILYMISPPEKQAKLKQQLIGLVVSAVVIFGGYYIWKILTVALDNLTTG